MNDLEERLRADFQQATASVEDTIDAEVALLAGRQARSSRRLARTVGMAALAAVVGLVGWGVLRTEPVLGGHPDPMGPISAVPNRPSATSSPYVPTDPMSATFDLGGKINGQVDSYESIGVSVEPTGDLLQVHVSLNETAKKASRSVVRSYTITPGKFWHVVLDRHLVLSIVPGRPSWFQQRGDAAKGSVTDQHPLVGINATAYLTGYIKAGEVDTLRGFLWRGADGVVQDSLGNLVPSAEISLADDTYWVYRDPALDTIGVVPRQSGGGYSFRLSSDKPGDLVHGSMGTKPDGGQWSWTQFGSLPPGSHDVKVVMAAPGGSWGSAVLSDGWVVVLANAKTKSSDVITSITYTGADGTVVNFHS